MPTTDDAHILLRFVEQWNTPNLMDAKSWFLQNIAAPGVRDVDDFRRHAPEGSLEERYAHQIAGTLDVAGVLVKHGLLDEDVFFDALPLLGVYWVGLGEWVGAERGKHGEGAFARHFEWLARRGFERRGDDAPREGGRQLGRDAFAPRSGR